MSNKSSEPNQIVRARKSYFRWTVCSLLVFLFIASLSCSNREKTSSPVYTSLSDSARYEGIATCKQCHADKYETFIRTGMGMSFDSASEKKSSAVFPDHAPVYDKYRDYSYYPHWDNDKLVITELRIKGHDTIYERNEKISWIVGSGQHTNSHLMSVNGYVYQVPLTYYTQKEKWDLPPGFEGGHNSRFSRMIGLECMTCHNAFPGFVQGSENKYNFVANGIDCERCHGPGAQHVKEKLEGKIVDVKNAIDYTIVNPAKLPINLQMDVCQRCHIQGNAVLKNGKSFLDFKPGMKLSDVMDVYMPSFSGDDDSHIMASHAERLKMSKCFLTSIAYADKQNKIHPSLTPYKNAMTCITCHDPHVSVRSTDQSVFNNKCQSCHVSTFNTIDGSHYNSGKECKDSEITRMKAGNNCVSCHMPKNGTIDIPHVVTTDHWIRIPSTKGNLQSIKIFAGLACINNSMPDKKSKGIAYLSYFEKFSPNSSYLDSAKKYFNDENSDSITEYFSQLIRWAFLMKDYKKLISYTNTQSAILEHFRSSVMNDDAWTSYRIGEAYYSQNDLGNAINYYGKAVELAPYNPDFRNKLAGAQLDSENIVGARNNYEFILKENPDYVSAYVSLGFLIFKFDGNYRKADLMYEKALSLDPDNIQALMNKAGIQIFLGKKKEARNLIIEVLKRDKDNYNAKLILKQL